MVKYNDSFLKGEDVLSEYKNKYQSLDAFWDVSSLVPRERPIRALRKSTAAVDVTQGEEAPPNDQGKLSDTVITRSIPSAHIVANNDLTEAERYAPADPLIHNVILYKEVSGYDFYADFCRQAEEYLEVNGVECEYSDFFSYSPQYDQLTSAQLAYYFWWRECVRSGRFIKTNTCYINLMFYELINVGDKIGPLQARDTMIELVVGYKDMIRGSIAKYIKWIVDFSLIHKLDPPKKHSRFLVENATTLREYFVIVPQNDTLGWARALLDYCCSYDYRTSKFAKDESLELFDTHVVAALARVVEYLSANGRILSSLPFGDCKMTTKAFEGAICATKNRYTTEVEYCSFSRSHELRFLVGDVVKHCENRIRGYIFIKSRLTVYSLPSDVQEVVDEYFNTYLPPRKRLPVKKQEPQEYDVLYDVPRRALDLSNAARIESESWETTKELVEAFDEPTVEISVTALKQPIVQEILPQTDEEVSLMVALGDLGKGVKALASNDISVLIAHARSHGKPIEAIVDAINEIAVDVIGDMLIDGADGDYEIIDDYRELIE